MSLPTRKELVEELLHKSPFLRCPQFERFGFSETVFHGSGSESSLTREDVQKFLHRFGRRIIEHILDRSRALVLFSDSAPFFFLFRSVCVFVGSFASIHWRAVFLNEIPCCFALYIKSGRSSNKITGNSWIRSTNPLRKPAMYSFSVNFPERGCGVLQSSTIPHRAILWHHSAFVSLRLFW